MVSSLYSGASGLTTLGSAMQVIGNNIANVNTVGFKASRAEFGDLLSQRLAGSARGSQVGRGVKLEGVTGLFSQGSFQNTSQVTDLAISGEGFFIVSDGTSDYYTRAGAFSVNAEGTLVNTADLAVQGFLYDSNGVNTGVIGDISLSNLLTPPVQTDEVTIALNLDADSTLPNPPAGFDVTDPAATSNFNTSITVYDSLGAPHTLSVYFEKSDDPSIPDYSADLSWKWHAVVDGGEISGGTEGTPTEIFSGTMTFNSDGSLRTVTQSAGTVDFAGGATAGQQINFDFGSPTGTALPFTGTGLDGTTQFAGPQVVNYQSQDGYPQGQLQAVDIDSDGIVTGVFSNGRTRAIAQVALANFQNEQGLMRAGGNLFRESRNSGVPTIGEANAGSLGSINASTLELSNVDLSNEFISMITTQRGFQANSRMIVVGDEMLESMVNLT
ncbi:flagellar hook protein FlgE [Candidatus Sumerlaeota bacterium]|nr:flagellar hook protein FlgE [Candidatus Sumerlaeota bacterium]